MPSESEPPPIYSPEAPDLEESLSDSGAGVEPQILIIPTGDDVSFQRGYLGADGERAAIEGELQLKCADSFRWEKVTMVLRTVETAYETEIELGASEVVLFSSSSDDGGSVRSSFPFAIPLPSDTPQCIHTSHSSLSHTLTANVYAASSDDSPVLSKAIIIHTRRYSAHSDRHPIAPETRTLEDPTHVEIQVPRTTYRIGEHLPIYVTIPVPRRELVVEQGLRLRNIRAELVRFVSIKREDDDDLTFGQDLDFDMIPDEAELHRGDAATSSAVQKAGIPSSSSQGVDFRPTTGAHGEQKVISLSGASCRLHPTRPIRIRLVLHPPTESPLMVPTQDLPTADYYSPDNVECASISQTTLLHSTSFRLRVHVAFMNMTSRTERISTVSIPIVVLPPSAPLPEIEESMDTAYHKKHDRPPTRTVRLDDMDVPRYYEAEAGPSFHGGAPPPFEEREAPPPFSTGPEASTSSRLPTFLESEREIYVPLHEDATIDPPSLHDPELMFEGEGTLFGFPASEQFDGHADMERSFTPPPTVEMATRDTDVTGLANLSPNVAMEALGLALGLDHPEENMDRGPPPPPPPMDDPSDPPPSIDSDFRGPHGTHQSPNPHPPPSHPPGLQITDQDVHTLSNSSVQEGGSHGHAPPPYRVPDNDADHDQGTGPPPYVDLVHRSH